VTLLPEARHGRAEWGVVSVGRGTTVYLYPSVARSVCLKPFKLGVAATADNGVSSTRNEANTIRVLVRRGDVAEREEEEETARWGELHIGEADVGGEGAVDEPDWTRGA
jgi:hypothetical protein